MALRIYGLAAMAALSLSFVASAGCSASTEGGSAASNTDGGGTATGGDTAQGGNGGAFNPTGGSQNTGGMEICEATAAEAEQKILDMIVVLDRSGSMGGAPWTGSLNALNLFFGDPTSAGVWAGINFFPPTGAGDQCDPGTYNPPQVQLGELPTYATNLQAAMAATSPSGGTPTEGALFGSLQFATGHQDLNPEHAVIVVLASDGNPTSCNTDPLVIADLASKAFNYNGVQTFAIAIQGAAVATLNLIASAGGTGQAFDVTSDISLFKQKMDEIRALALGCEYSIPVLMGEEFDPLNLNLNYTAGGTTTPQDIPQAANEADCGNGPGWYYDNPSNPTKVFLCPATCAQVEADIEAKIELLFGCPTKMN